ncbi:gliding motility-associated C-terminal domain-containing protein [Arenibacter sp. H213]|uniref:Gliding motility-associated C-terminal domain-containing protein n=1 Tax=Arenibacter antarcticus TaxID=2040469 RepID=A0ABW5VDK0_9FLAO|nr:gliding motility-associated C-terminal domain-containing protein [Arenibacter sp. H213]
MVPKAVSKVNKTVDLLKEDFTERIGRYGDPLPPTTKNSSQEFCALNRPTLHSIQINESNVIWYHQETNGNPLDPSSLLEENTTYYAAQIIANDESPGRLAISVLLGVPSSPTTNDTVQVFSTSENPTIGDIKVTETNIIWYDAPVEGKLLHFDTPLENGIKYFASQVINNCESVDRLPVKIALIEPSDITITKTVNNKRPIIGEKVILTITVQNDGTSVFNDIVINEQLGRGFTYINAKTTNGSFNPSDRVWTLSSLPSLETAVLYIEVEATPNGDYSSISTIESAFPKDKNLQNNSAEITLEPSCITIYNEFTPNDDGDNDYFRIDCIETFPESVLQIFNRYGALVYHKKGYQNDWRGFANVSGSLGKGSPLPTGTYFYSLKTNGLSENKTGWLFLRKE